MIKSPSMIGYLKNLVIPGSKVADESQKWSIKSGRRFVFYIDNQPFLTVIELRSGGSFGYNESGSAKSNANLNLPSGFGLSNFIVFNSISRKDWSNHSSKSREISCWKHVKTRLVRHKTETISELFICSTWKEFQIEHGFLYHLTNKKTTAQFETRLICP